MSKHTWYLVGLVLLAAACSPVLEPKSVPFVPGHVQAGPAQDSSQTYGWRGEGNKGRRLFVSTQ